MSNTSYSAGNSAIASSSTARLEIAPGAFWVRLYADDRNPGQLVAKRYDRKLCLFERGAAVPAHWQAGQFVIVRSCMEKEKFVVVAVAVYQHANRADMADRVAQAFSGRLEQVFEVADDADLLAWLDAEFDVRQQSDEVEAAVTAEQRILEAQLAREDAAIKERDEHQAFVSTVSAPLTDAGKVWFRSWLGHDRHYAFSDDARVFHAGGVAQARLHGEFKALLQVDREALKGSLKGTARELPGSF